MGAPVIDTKPTTAPGSAISDCKLEGGWHLQKGCLGSYMQLCKAPSRACTLHKGLQLQGRLLHPVSRCQGHACCRQARLFLW